MIILCTAQVGLGKRVAEFIARLRYEYRLGEDSIVCQYTCLVGLYDGQPPVAHAIIVKVTSQQEYSA